jgi:hypothetical protein
MSTSTKRVQLIGAPPCSGKTAAREKLQQELRKRSGQPWLVLEHEDVFSPEMRVRASRASNLELSSKDFVMGFNLPGQIAFQKILRTIASQGIPVVGFGPFENVYGKIGQTTLYAKMLEQDFAGFDFSLAYFLVSGEGAEEEVQKRLRGRAGKSEWQPVLDADKLGVDGYYEGRAKMVRLSSDTFDLPLVEYPVGQSVDWLVDRLATIILR